MNVIGGSTRLADGLPKTAFGELSVAQNTVLCGWNFPYNLNPALVSTEVTNGGTVTHADNYVIAQSGTNAAGTAVVRTKAQLAYTPGIGGVMRDTAIFSEPQAGASQLIGLGDDQDGLFFGFDGLQFGVLRRSRGVDTWVYQDSWNVDTRPDFDYTLGNVFSITFQWLGYGMIFFGMENALGQLADVHRIAFANTSVDTTLDVPSLPVTIRVSNGGVNTTNVAVRSPSAVAMSQGDAFPQAFETLVGYSYLQAVASGSNYLFTIRNPATYQSKNNKLFFALALLTLTSEVNKAVTFTVLRDATLTTPTYTDIDLPRTPAQVDTVAAAYTGGEEIATFTVPAAGGQVFDLASIFSREKVWPDSTITVIAEAGGAGDVTVGLTFRSRM